mgnify:FL=1
MAPKSFLDTINPKGHLEIIKTYLDGTSEVLLDEHNVITVGMGVTLAALFANDNITASAGEFAMAYFQVGKDTKAMDTSATTLKDQLSLIEYGTDSSLTVQEHLTSTNSTQAFIHTNSAYVARSALSKVTFTILISDDTANNQTLQEIGLWSKNPLQLSPSRSYLCAYRTFSSIAKTSDFSLTFRWTIDF